MKINVPKEYRENYLQFFKVLLAMHLPGDLQFQRVKLAEIDQKLKTFNLTERDREDISLTWEAIGRQSIPSIRKHYDNPDNHAQFYAVKTAINLDDDDALNHMINIAVDDKHSYQMAAIEFLAKEVDDSRVYTRLEKLLAHDDPRVQLAVYKTLSQNRGLAINSYDMTGDFRMDIIDTSPRALIYIWAYREPRIVIFGKNLVCRKNIFFGNQAGTIKINSNIADKDIKVIKTSPTTHKSISARTTTFLVKDLIDALACSTEARRPGIGLNFSEIAAVLKQLSVDGVIPADVLVYTGDDAGGDTESKKE